MQLISVPVMGYAPPRWIPAHAAPRVMNPRLGDNPVPTASLSFIDSPLASLITDVAAATSIGMLGYVFYKGQSMWSNVFFAASAIFAVKAIVDIKRLQ
ncbi:MAG TPA: hypothetical protein VEN81_13230 [Planctomycetota bacterium]|jgi:hypothetical protein|nr:hypothetical protein [Planctomycetota bacterium]